MVDKECTCLFYWTQLFDRHTKQLIKLELQDRHIGPCHQYKNAKSLVEANGLYVIIYCRWLSFGATFKVGVHELVNWLNFWHFPIKQWGSFMVHVNISPTNFL
jgi:hypothetical protein